MLSNKRRETESQTNIWRQLIRQTYRMHGLHHKGRQRGRQDKRFQLDRWCD